MRMSRLTVSTFSASLSVSEDELPGLRGNLEGFLDLHIHLAPDQVLRTHDDVQFAEQARKIGYRGFLMKDHYSMTAARAYDVSKMFGGLAVGGGIVLNRAVGGLNPDAVEAALKVGAKEVWMPTFDSVNHFRFFGMFSLPGLIPVREVKRNLVPFAGISLLGPEGRINDQVLEILDMVADAGAIIGTGHVSLDEIRGLVDAGRKAGVKKMLVTHPEFQATSWPASAQAELAGRGAMIEHCANANYDAEQTAQNIRAVGADRCVLSSDSGQVKKGHPAVYMSRFVKDLMVCGITEKEIRKMMVENPAKLMGVD